MSTIKKRGGENNFYQEGTWSKYGNRSNWPKNRDRKSGNATTNWKMKKSVCAVMENVDRS